MYSFLIVIHVIVALLLIIVILIQSGQKTDIASVFGGSGTQTVFGPRGAATILTKVTAVLATIFILTSISLYIISSKRGKASVIEKVPVQGEKLPKK